MQAVQTTAQWKAHIRSYFEVSSYPGVYVLGSFARRVTIYSQQARAFNLIFGLYKTGVLRPGLKIGILGAGAAGLTAAAALNYLSDAHKLNLTIYLLETASVPMSMQATANHRWIHPHIYDWPNQRTQGARSKLPIFDWKAAKADDVVSQIESAWHKNSNNVSQHFSASRVDLIRQNGYTLKWHDAAEKSFNKPIDIFIIAIGFGLELKSIDSKSYWSHDDVDELFHPEREDERWLVSGSGDGALTDLMRCCIDKFKLEDLVSILDTFAGRKGLVRDIDLIYKDPKINRRPKTADQEISRRFHDLSIDELVESLHSKIKKRGPEVFLTSKTPHIYGNGSSVLNRLLVLCLARAGAFVFLPGPVGQPQEIEGARRKLRVPIGYPAHFKEFDRAITRHGTDDEILMATFKHLMDDKACDRLRSKWTNVKPQQDLTRYKMWDDDFFGPENLPDVAEQIAETEGMSVRSEAFEKAVGLYGAKLSQFSSYKDLQSTGQSVITYEFEGLQSVTRPISGIHFTYDSVVGKIGSPMFDKVQEKRYGLAWEADIEKYTDGDPMIDLRRRLSRLSGTIRFAKPLSPSDPPMTFTMKIEVLNGDALSAWEFDQLYNENERVHIDTKRLRYPMEFFSRIVWCPIEKIRLRVKLPEQISNKAVMSSFRLPPSSGPAADEVWSGSILWLYPPDASPCHPDRGNWETHKESNSNEFVHFTNPNSQTWELSVDKPYVGSCYSIDWRLPDSRLDEDSIAAAQAKALRKSLLSYRESRRSNTRFSQKRRIRGLLKTLYQKIEILMEQMAATEEFDLELMAYDDAKRQLWFVDGTQDGSDPPKSHFDYHFSFGLGLAGACMKHADRTFMYLGDSAGKQGQGPEYYLKVAGLQPHEGLAVIPVLYSEWYPTTPEAVADTSRMCIALINISFKSKTRWLQEVQNDESRLNSLRALCQNFGDSLCEVLDQTVT